MMKILADRAEEKLLKAVMVYADSNNKLFYDSTATTDKVNAAELTNLFKKGLVVKKGSALYKPTELTESSGTVTVSLVYFTGSPAAATLLSFTSQERS